MKESDIMKIGILVLQAVIMVLEGISDKNK